MQPQPYEWSPLVFEEHVRHVTMSPEHERRSARAPRIPVWLTCVPLTLLVVAALVVSTPVHDAPVSAPTSSYSGSPS